VVSDLIEHRLETLAQALLQDTKPWQAQTAFQPERLAARRGKAETVEDALPRNTSSKFTQAKEEADLVDAEFDDVLDVTATPQTATPEPLNLSALDLPDLNLSDVKPISEDDESGASNV
jgi:hypothetical protein